ncbi:mesaconyl-CoA isomerase [Streptomyces dysideae]|uniref:Mesaconyl-CoA isomerase n=1 Tax=Streptomyces dysideae TaxID=909626 RepID=A0A101UT81_9ACTN|nr:mesaconyl-CoA isomerase [Streptomyces dysideae]
MRVIEVSSFVAAPLGGMTLSQLGAEVIRVDPLDGAADTRRWPLTKSGASLYWAGLNKGKRSLMVNMRSDAGRAIVRDLVATCPAGTAVVLTNAVGRPWLSYDELSAVCPDLIHVQIEGRSDGSPAVDYTVNAEVGFPMVTGPAGHGDPVNHVLPAWDIACGLYAALGVSAAARRRAATGEGDQVRVALADVALAMAGNLGFLAEAQVNNVQRQRIGNYLYGGFARDFTCSDGGRLMVVALTGRHWRDLLEVTGMHKPVAALEESLRADFSVEDDRFEYREVLAGLFQRWFADRPMAEVCHALTGTSLVWSPYRSFGQAVQHLQSSDGANPIMSIIDQPDIGPHLAPGSPLTFASAPFDAEPAPLLGQHTRAILADDLGLSAEEIEGLHRDKAVAGPLRRSSP